MTTEAFVVGSVCSGIGAPECGWRGLGWHSAFLSEIEPFPRAVLAQRFPGVPLHGDFTTIKAGDYEPIDLLVGGTPCQSFSVAGLRGGLADERGNLALEYLRLADRLRPRWLVWENVPGVLSSSKGRDFGAFLGGLGELGYGFAYRVLDAQHFGVAQRRRRVFVVGYLGDWRRAAAVLFEPASLRRHPAPRREAGAKPAPTISARPTGGGGLGTDFDLDGGLIALDIVPAMTTRTGTGTGRDGMDEYCVPVSFPWQQGGSMGMQHSEDICGTLVKNQTQAVTYGLDSEHNGRLELMGPMQAKPGTNNLRPSVSYGAAVRRLTPRECERLQGFPDNWTAITHRSKPAADGPRYKALGNSMAVPVLTWIGKRIAMQEARHAA